MELNDITKMIEKAKRWDSRFLFGLCAGFLIITLALLYAAICANTFFPSAEKYCYIIFILTIITFVIGLHNLKTIIFTSSHKLGYGCHVSAESRPSGTIPTDLHIQVLARNLTNQPIHLTSVELLKPKKFGRCLYSHIWFPGQKPYIESNDKILPRSDTIVGIHLQLEKDVTDLIVLKGVKIMIRDSMGGRHVVKVTEFSKIGEPPPHHPGQPHGITDNTF